MRCSIVLLCCHNVLKLVTAANIKGSKALLWRLFERRAESRLLSTLMLSGCFKETTYFKTKKSVRFSHLMYLQASCNSQNNISYFCKQDWQNALVIDMQSSSLTQGFIILLPTMSGFSKLVPWDNEKLTSWMQNLIPTGLYVPACIVIYCDLRTSKVAFQIEGMGFSEFETC